MRNHRLRARLGAAILAASLAVGTGCAIRARRAHPPDSLDAALTGLGAEVTVHLDALGVPHVFAADEDDASFAIGLLHARARGFQMELIRMASQGRLTEVLGEGYLDTDRRLRLLTYNLDATVASLPEVDQRRLEAYCAGINHGLELFPTPVEFKLKKHEVAPWTPRDVVAVGRLQSWSLSVDASREALRDRVALATPPALHSWLMAASPAYGRPVVSPEDVASERLSLPSIPPPSQGKALLDASGAPLAAVAGAAPGEALARGVSPIPPQREGAAPGDADALLAAIERFIGGPLGGSNSWAIAPQHTRHGKAILAGDPHLDMDWPSTFYEVHVHTPEVDYSGATFPGMPMVVIGRAEHVAWTLTTSYADAQDLFSLKVDPEDPMRYELDGEWVPFTPWEQTFRWGDGEDEAVTETWRVSEFGPEYGNGRGASIAEGRTYALGWPSFRPDPLPMTSMFSALYHAGTAEEVVDAVRMLPTPSQNWTFATDEGRIGYVLGGALPDRRASALPRDGTTRASAWEGYLSEADRPVVIDPPTGLIYAPNQPILADVGRFNTYASGVYRAIRIASALESREDWDLALTRALQVDLINEEAVHLLPIMLDALGDVPSAGQPPAVAARLTAMVDALKGWGYAMEAEAAAPLIYESWRAHLHQGLFGRIIPDPELLRTLLDERATEAPMWLALTDPAYASKWDDPATPAVETLGDALARALVDADAELTAAAGDDPSEWTWGSLHTLDLSHPFASVKILRPTFGAEPIPLPGGRHTVYALDNSGIIGDYRVTSGPALRQAVEPGGTAGFTLNGGNAGQLKHPQGKNQLPAWIVGQQHKAGGSLAEIEASAVGTLHLRPAP